jgi:hypothetical protein
MNVYPAFRPHITAIPWESSRLHAGIYTWRRTDSLSQHSARTADCHGGDLLLPLPGVSRAQRLRENVRIAEVRCAAMGNKLRQATHQAAHGESRRWTAISASRPQRASTNREARDEQLSPGFSVDFRSSGLFGDSVRWAKQFG